MTSGKCDFKAVLNVPCWYAGARLRVQPGNTHTRKEDKVNQSVVISAFHYIQKCFWTWENTLWNEFVHYKLRDNDVHSST